jgi:hypothetical protein
MVPGGLGSAGSCGDIEGSHGTEGQIYEGEAAAHGPEVCELTYRN